MQGKPSGERCAAVTLGFDALDALEAAVVLLDEQDPLRETLAAIRDHLGGELNQIWASGRARAPSPVALRGPRVADALLDKLWTAA